MKRIISFALFCATIISSVAMFASCSRKEQSEPTTTYDYDVIADNENVTGKVSELPSEIVFMRSDTVGNAEYKATSTFIATVLPVYATNKACTWSLAWADSAETANLNDYVRISVSETDSREVTVNLVEYFGEKTINLTCTTVDSGKTAIVPLTCFEAVKIIGIKDSEGNYVTRKININTDYYKYYDKNEVSLEEENKCTYSDSRLYDISSGSYAYALGPSASYVLDCKLDSRYDYTVKAYGIAVPNIRVETNVSSQKASFNMSVFREVEPEVAVNNGSIAVTVPEFVLSEGFVDTGIKLENSLFFCTREQIIDAMGENPIIWMFEITDNTFGTSAILYLTIDIPVESVSCVSDAKNCAFIINA